MSRYGINRKTKIFADEYLIDLNATRAYRVYPTVKNDDTAAAAGAKLLEMLRLRHILSRNLKSFDLSVRVTDAEVMEHLTAVMRGEVKEEVVVVEGAGEGFSEAKIIESNRRNVTGSRPPSCSAKRYSMFTDKVDVNGVEGVVIVNDIPKPDNTG